MRALLWLVGIFAAIWGGVWWVASSAVQDGAETALANIRASGKEAQASVSVQGFPNRLDLTLDALTLTDPATGLGWTTPFAQVFAMTWKPWHLIAVLPSGQVIRTPAGDIGLDADRLRASVLLHPDTSLGLSEVVLEGAAVKLSAQNWGATLATLAGGLREGGTPETQRIGLTLTTLAPTGDDLVRAVAQAGLPEAISTIGLDATATLTAPLNRFAAEANPSLVSLDLASAKVEWGALQIFAKGQITAGPDGLAVGEVMVDIAGWTEGLALAVAMESMTQPQADAVGRGLDALAKSGKDPAKISLPLRLKDGWMTFGPLTLGPAPRLQ